MSMSNYSKSHERDENRRMNKGLAHSLFGAALCWLPLLGLALAVSGFLRVVVRITQAHRAKKAVLTALTLVVLAGCIGVLCAQVYAYANDPGILDTAVNTAWHTLTGQEQPPWVTAQQAALDPEDAYSSYGQDPYAVDLEDEALDGDDYQDYDEDEAWDADFDDSELYGFEEDDTGEEDAAGDGSTDSAAAQRALYDQLRQSRSTRGVG